MLAPIKLFFGKYLNYIVIGTVVTLLVGNLALGYLYNNQLERNAQIQTNLDIQTAAVKDLNKKLEDERKASERLQLSYRTVNRNYNKLYKQLEEVSRDPDTNRINDDVIDILCKAGIASRNLCRKEGADPGVPTGGN